ncbi:DUF2188 domain-containing protein [uncultured Leifsonia sp.]|uniref:DUF2188 domain-containing protein n=1 Tax=uncultured Leifsonia sp. TaxID=340359 RepID=UPI0028D6B677|nr:DUF2188 domain-containing protein [uncultured Leifsonia sp.]
MANVFVEPVPKGSDAPITGYVVEYAGGGSLDGKTHDTQEEAIKAARQAGHQPLVARVRVTDKGKPDQWRSA